MPDVYTICEFLLACLCFIFVLKYFFSKIITSLFLSLAVMNLITIEKALQFLSARISFSYYFIIFFKIVSCWGVGEALQ